MCKLNTPNKQAILFVCTFLLGVVAGFVTWGRSRSTVNSASTPLFVMAELRDDSGRMRLLVLKQSERRYVLRKETKERILDEAGEYLITE